VESFYFAVEWLAYVVGSVMLLDVHAPTAAVVSEATRKKMATLLGNAKGGGKVVDKLAAVLRWAKLIVPPPVKTDAATSSGAGAGPGSNKGVDSGLDISPVSFPLSSSIVSFAPAVAAVPVVASKSNLPAAINAPGGGGQIQTRSFAARIQQQQEQMQANPAAAGAGSGPENDPSDALHSTQTRFAVHAVLKVLFLVCAGPSSDDDYGVEAKQQHIKASLAELRSASFALATELANSPVHL
ncbi:unnamed protein product, partial [Amoebophrya sp. A25]